MTTTSDYYKILGVIPCAEAVVIKAAYRALANIYHPDKNSSQEAEGKMREINLAYETLSNSVKRKQYDEALEKKTNDPSHAEFECKKPFENDSLGDAWNTATSFYPKIENYYNYLGKISWRLAFAYKLQLLEEKQFQKAEDIAIKIKKEYLSSYFGNNDIIRDYAERLIIAREVQVAFHINNIVKIMGKSVSMEDIENNIKNNFSDLFLLIEKKILYNQIKDWNNRYYKYNAYEFIKLHGGSVKSSFFGGNISLSINNKYLTFENPSEFCEYILELYKEEYA